MQRANFPGIDQERTTSQLVLHGLTSRPQLQPYVTTVRHFNDDSITDLLQRIARVLNVLRDAVIKLERHFGHRVSLVRCDNAADYPSLYVLAANAATPEPPRRQGQNWCNQKSTPQQICDVSTSMFTAATQQIDAACANHESLQLWAWQMARQHTRHTHQDSTYIQQLPARNYFHRPPLPARTRSSKIHRRLYAPGTRVRRVRACPFHGMHHWRALQHVAKCLFGTSTYGLICKPGAHGLHSESDSEFAGCKLTRKSTYGCVARYGNCLISWNSRRIAGNVICTATA